MKKAISRILVVAMLICMVLSVASCAKKLSGNYVLDATAAGTGVVTTYKFSGSDVTLVVETKLLGTVTDTVTVEGTYEITEKESGDLQITLTFEGEDADEYNTTADFKEAEDGKSITIGILTFTKKD